MMDSQRIIFSERTFAEKDKDKGKDKDKNKDKDKDKKLQILGIVWIN